MVRRKRKTRASKAKEIIDGVIIVNKKLGVLSMPKINKEEFVKIAVTLPEVITLQEDNKLVGWDGKGTATIRK